MIKKVFLALFGLFIAAQAVGTFAGAAYLRSQTKPQIVSKGLPSSILVDSKGQLWVQPWAEENSQDFKWEVYQNGVLTQTFDVKNEPNFPARIAMDLQGNLFGVLKTGSSGYRIVEYDGASWKALAELPLDTPLFLDTLSAASRDDVWIGWFGQIHHYNGSGWETYTSDNSPLPGATINDVFVDSRKRVWVGTTNGIALIKNGNFQTLADSGLGGISIQAFAESGDGIIWAAGDRGVYSFDGLQWTLHDSENSKLLGSRIYDIEADASGRVWALSAEGDFSVLDGAKTRYMFGTPRNQIRDFEIGADGTLYLMRTDDVGMLGADTPLINLIALKFLRLSNNGVVLYLSVFLLTIWAAIALNSWGMGLGPALGGMIFWGVEAFSLFSVNGVPLGYINPGFALTVFTFIGGLVGYFFKQKGKKYADLIGGGIGCAGGGVLLACVFTVFVAGLMATGG